MNFRNKRKCVLVNDDVSLKLVFVSESISTVNRALPEQEVKVGHVHQRSARLFLLARRSLWAPASFNLANNDDTAIQDLST